MQEQPRTMPIERKRERKVRKAPEAIKAETVESKTVNGKDVKDLSFDELLALHKSEQTKGKDVIKEDKAEENHDISVEKPRQILKPSSNRERKVKTGNKKLYFPLTSAAEIRSKDTAAEDCEEIFNYYKKQAQDTSDDVAEEMEKLQISPDNVNKDTKHYLGYFKSKEDMYSLLSAEIADQSDDVEARTVLSLWSGDIASVIEAAIAESRMTERLLAHAAGVSVKLWKKAAESLGRQMIRDGEVLRGAEYLVSAGHVIDAVAELTRHGHHRAAVSVARSRCPHDSDAVVKAMKAWAHQSQSDGEIQNSIYSNQIILTIFRKLWTCSQMLVINWMWD